MCLPAIRLFFLPNTTGLFAVNKLVSLKRFLLLSIILLLCAYPGLYGVPGRENEKIAS